MTKKLIEDTIIEIENDLRPFLFSNDISLMNGASGHAVFYFNLYSVTKKKIYFNIGVELLDFISNNLTVGMPHSICNGLAGIGWIFEYLNNNKFIKIDVENLLEDIDDELLFRVNLEIENNNFDYLHGAIGIGFYFLYKKESDIRSKILCKIINGLENSIIKIKSGYRWGRFDNTNGYNADETNFSLSHGMSNVIIFLTECCMHNVNPKQAQDLLIKATRHFVSSIQNFNIFHSYFPSIISYHETERSLKYGRLAWCYGDLGAVVGLISANRILKDDNLNQIIKTCILSNSLEFDHLKKSVFDHGFCHGSSGIAHIFDYISYKTNNLLAKEAGDYWIKNILTYKSDPILNKLSKSYELNGVWKNNRTLLEGSTGIGLVLIDRCQVRKNDWSYPLLLI